MKRVILFILLSIPVFTYSQTSLMDWGKNVDENKLKTEKNYNSNVHYTPVYIDGNFMYSDTLLIKSKSEDEIFSNLLYWISDTFVQVDKVIKKIDPASKRILLHSAHLSKEYSSSGTFYDFDIAFQVENSIIIFQQFNFNLNTLGSGLSLSYKKDLFNDIFPNIIPSKRKYEKYLSDVMSLNDSFLNGLTNHVLNNNYNIKIKYWDEINSHIPALGMNYIECILSIGKPEKINNTILEGLQSEQWVYPNNKYVYFSNGTLNSIQF